MAANEAMAVDAFQTPKLARQPYPRLERVVAGTTSRSAVATLLSLGKARPTKKWPAPCEEEHGGSAKRWTYAMPAMTHAKFVRRWAWLKENEIQFSFGNGRCRREHPIWRDDVVAAGGLAPAYGDDPDAVASDGHR